MFESRQPANTPDKQNPLVNEKVVTMTISDDDLHVMPTNYLPTTDKVKRTGSSNRIFFFILGGLALVLAIVIAGLVIYLRIQAPGQTLEVNVNSAPPEIPVDTNTNQPEVTPISRDLQRIKDITDIQAALRLYFEDLGMYPQVLAGVPQQYLADEPRDPLSGQKYIYQPLDNASSYSLTFNLEQQSAYGSQILAAGSQTVGPNGLITGVTPPVTEVPPVVEQPQNQDGDQDGLTAAEEVSFKTSPDLADTDGDGFKDGEEVLNLYSPISSNRAELSVSGLVKSYVNPIYNYSTWYVEDWVVRSLDASNREIIFSSPVGDSVIIQVQPNEQSLAIKDWYLSQNPGTPAVSLREQTVGEFKGVRSQDGLQVYFTDGISIFGITYDAVQDVVYYPTVFELIIKSFSFNS